MIDKIFTTNAQINDNQSGNVKTFTTDSLVAEISQVSYGASFFLLVHKCNVKRRKINSKNALNEPDYGRVKDWENIYINLPCRLEIRQWRSDIQFKPTGERIEPGNILYVDASTPLKVEDRIFILNNSVSGLGYQQEFIVQGTVPALNMVGNPEHHLEYNLIIP